MPNKNHVFSETATNESLRILFRHARGKDSVTPEEAYRAFGREGRDKATNRPWLSNKMTGMRLYGLIDPQYSSDKRLESIKITPKGAKVLSKTPEGQLENQNNFEINEAKRLLKEWEGRNPEFEVIFDVRLKK